MATLDAWPDLLDEAEDGARGDPMAPPGGALALIGPEGSGKTHLAAAWAQRTGAVALRPGDLDAGDPPHGPLLLEDADRIELGEAFFHLINRAAGADACLLVTGRTPPKRWRVGVPDLRSRVNALAIVEIGAMDDAVLRGVLLSLFQQRHIRPPPDLLEYLLRRIERSAAAAAAIVGALDEAAGAEHLPVSRVLARRLLRDEGEEPQEGR